MRNILPLIFLMALQCKALSFNNPSDLSTDAFLENKECFEIPQDNQGVKEWTRLLGQTGGVQTYSQSTIAERYGYIYSVGTTDGALLGQTKISSSGTDLYIAKYDREGNTIWLKQMGSTGAATTYSELAHIDIFGDLYIIGSSGGPFNELPASGSGSLLIKLTPSGAVLWTRIFPTGSETLGSGVTTDGEGNVYITGNTEEQLIDEEVAAGGRNTFLFKYNRNGDYVWKKLIDNGGPSSYGYQVQYDPFSRNILLVGQLSGAGTFLGNGLPGGLLDSYLIAFNTNGVPQWVQFLGMPGGTISTNIKALSVDKKGSVYVTGDTSGNLDGQTKEGNTVQVLTKYSIRGDKLWTRLLGGGGTTETNGVQVFADNAFHVYTTGNTTGNVNGVTRIGAQDTYLSKYDGNGNLIWTRNSGSSGSTLYGRGISSDRYGTLYFSGFTNGNIDGQTKQGTYDAFLMQYK
ncbi:SBBP repeat-containing protein [Leptospira sp. 201903075]|uniref:SBBP repeat-containing protein n=1 Tax=Leptospira chreensis TaxID=2810035 RepID=UPI0019630A8D|nr:SBBP repeat-containing protein [Leptospira chreensis]MBM9590191.1 SBBP repeat-containing protein [Leptospira chreensis]